MSFTKAELLHPCAECGHPWNAHHFEPDPKNGKNRITEAGIFCSRFSNGDGPCVKKCPGYVSALGGSR